MKLNLGCGSKVLPDYTNIDLFVRDERVVNMDISKLTYESSTCDEILAEDIIEHFPRLVWKNVMSEWIRVLKSNGTLKLQFPEMKLLSKALVDCETFDEWEKINRRIFGGQGDGIGDGSGMFHYTGFCYEYMRLYLENCHSMIYVDHKFHNFNCYLTMRKS